MTNILCQWRERIQKSQLAPITKLVLFNLSLYMSSKTNTCFPSTKQQALDTTLSERSVCTHLEIAEKIGFIKKNRSNLQGKRWARNEYKIAFPLVSGTATGSVPKCNKALKEIQYDYGLGTEGDSVRNKNKALKEIQYDYGLGTEGDSVRNKNKALKEIQYEESTGTESDDIQALKEVQSNYIKELPRKNLSTPIVPNGDDVKKVEQIFDDDFEEVWVEYVTSNVAKGSKLKARQKYGKIRKAGTQYAEIIEGVRRYAHYINETGSYSKQVITWLNARGWEDDYIVNHFIRNDRAAESGSDTYLASVARVLAKRREQRMD